jgi:hypothetical protein
MHERHPVEKELRAEAERLGEKYPGSPVVIVVGGVTGSEVNRTMTASNLHDEKDRFRDLLGLLEMAKQVETAKHVEEFKRKQADSVES